MNLAEILMLKFPDASFDSDIQLVDLGNGPQIQEWNIEGVDLPTSETIEEWRNEVQATYDLLKVQQLRRGAYLQAGVTNEALVVALWEAQVENRPETLQELQTIREEIKLTYPKPE